MFSVDCFFLTKPPPNSKNSHHCCLTGSFMSLQKVLKLLTWILGIRCNMPFALQAFVLDVFFLSQFSTKQTLSFEGFLFNFEGFCHRWVFGQGKKSQSPKGIASLRDSASKCCEQYIKSDFLHFWDPYVLLRSDFYSKGQAQCPL